MDVFLNVQFGFERDTSKRKIYCQSRTETGNDGFGKPAEYLVADVRGYSGQWFSLDLALDKNCKQETIRLRGYPIQRLFPVLYFTKDGIQEELELPDFKIGDDFNTHCLKFHDMPNKVTEVHLSLRVPDCPWFVLGFMPSEGV